MKDAQKIAEIVQSAYIRDLFVSSGLFAGGRQARRPLKKPKTFFELPYVGVPEGHSERERMLRACARLEKQLERCSCLIRFVRGKSRRDRARGG
jgi:hypothetical protein